MDFDVCIIGAGVTGCAIARTLSKYTLRILLIDQANDVAQGASKANSGIVHGGYDERHGTQKARVSHRGNRLFASLQRQLHFGFRRIGSLVVALNDAQMEELKRLLENGTKNGVRGLRIVTDKVELKKLEPNLNGDVVGAMVCKHTGITSPYEYCIALAENAVTNGVDVRLNHEVIAIRPDSGGFVVECKTNTDVKPMTYRTAVVINCAGIQSDKIARLVGSDNFHIVPRKGEYLVLDRTQGSLVNHVLFPAPDPVLGKGILVSPTYWGNLLIGPTSRSVEQNMTNREILKEIIQKAHRLIPVFDVRRTITSYAGWRAKSNLGDFIIEESRVPRFINVAGIDSPGLTSSPAIAVDVEALLKKLRHVPFKFHLKSNFQAHRPSIILLPKPKGFPGRIDDPDPEKNIICRCEQITEAEIEDAIHRPLGARTIAAVKKRTRAGMGRCQGAFCEPRVRALLSRNLNIPPEQIEGIALGSSLLAHRRPTDEDRQFLAELDRELSDKISRL